MSDYKRERDFQEVATEHGVNAVEDMREALDALEHAQECDGRQECEDCGGSGKAEGPPGGAEPPDCDSCGGEGSISCGIVGKGYDADNWHNEESARSAIEERPLSVEVRSHWHTPGEEDVKAGEYCILLGTGGPASRIVGDLDDYGQPDSARYEYQDWFKPWTAARLSSEQESTLLEYAQHFYFGE